MSHSQLTMSSNEVDIFQNLTTENNTLSNLESEISSTCRIIDDIRITPSVMVFANAYDGKYFKRKLTIQNIGSRLALIRLCPSTSSAFKFRHFTSGFHLSPGLKIVRNISFTYKTTFAVTQAFAPIWINEQSIDYQFIVTLSAAVISVEPAQLDFGRIDAVNVATTRTLHIKNSGFKGTHYAIDLGRNDLELIVEPMKGIIPAKSEVALEVEIVGAKPGEFVEEIWIKTNPPLRVVITGHFIEPRLMVRKFISGLDFTLLNFKKVYYGSTSTKPLVIKNHSSSQSMYYVTAEIKGETVPLDQARKIDDNYRQFVIVPEDGRLSAEEGAVVLFKFTPNYTPIVNKSYAACFIKVIRMDCRGISKNALDDYLPQEQDNVNHRNSVSSAHSTDPNLFFTDIIPDTLYETKPPEADYTQTLSFENFLRVCLLGEKEVADISFRPEQFFLYDLTIFKSYERELYIENKSSLLPITVKYRKCPNIDIYPNEFELRPSGKIEVRVVIKTAKIGTIVCDITFDLLAKDWPEKRNLRNVGSASAKIEYTTKAVQIKEHFKKCCLDQTKECQDLKLKLENEYPLKLQPHELIKKRLNDDFYLNLIRNNIAQRENFKEMVRLSKAQDYEVTDNLSVLHQKIKCCSTIKKGKLKDKPITPYIPLVPRQLYCIKIIPKSIRLRRVAAYTSTTDVFSVENRNPFPVRILLRPSKPCIHFFDDGRHIIASGEKKTITFIFSSCKNGKYNISIDVIVNEAAVFQITLIAAVVPKTLCIDCYNYHFKDDEEPFQFFSLINVLNAFTQFNWDVPLGCFDIYPRQGTVPAERSMTFMVTLKPDPSSPNATECVLTSESGQSRILHLSYKKKSRAVIFSSNVIDLGLVPLNININKTLVMKNVRNSSIIYRIINGAPIPGIQVDPVKGRLNGKDSQNFKISIQISAVIEFSTKITFHIDDKDDYDIEIRGVVEFPKIRIEPDVLYFRKIAPFSFDRLVFKIKNLSKLDCLINFQLEDFPEFSVSKSEDFASPEIYNIELKSHEARVLFLHCHPFHVCTFSFSLPYVINKILGPPTLVSVTSVFLEQHEAAYEKISKCELVKNIPPLLPTIRVNCCALDKQVEFSSLDMNFVYYKDDHYGNIMERDFEIYNCDDEAIKVCIRIDDLKHPFYIDVPYEDDEKVEIYDISYVVILEVGESYVFKIRFQPDDYGHYLIRLPIFLRHYIDDKIFNYLTLSGDYKTPEMEPSDKVFYFEPVLHNVKSEIDFFLNIDNHFEDCQFYSSSVVPQLLVMFHTKDYKPKGKQQILCSLTFSALNNICVDHELTISCTCKSSCEIHVNTTIENTLVTTNVFLHSMKAELGPDVLVALRNFSDEDVEVSTTSIVPPKYFSVFVNKNTTCYPFFPKNDDDSVYASYLRKLMESVENWLFTQIFRKKGYHKIPDGFTNFCVEVEKTRRKSLDSKNNIELPLVKVVLKLAGNKIKNFIITSECYSEEETKVMAYTYTTYSNILTFLRKKKALLPNVSAKILLSYQQYQLYYKVRGKKQNQEFKDEDTFYHYSKQCWLDLFLQIIKIFVIQRVDFPPTPRKDTLERPTLLEETDSQFEAFNYDYCMYGPPEKNLIKWLETCFAEQKSILWKTELENREINFFDDDLKDGLILGAVTAAYCPYVQHYIEDMFTDATTPEQIFHNACKLVQTWKSMKFSFEISPYRIVDPNMVEMLLLVAYLYDVLPSCLPRETLEIKTLLTQTRNIEIEIQNCGASLSLYEAIFFGNDRNLFSVAQPTLKVAPGRKRNLVVTYHAKCFTDVFAYLLLSGESGHNFAKNICVKLIGIPDVSTPYKEVPVKLPVYKVCQLSLELESPFVCEGEYDLNYMQTSSLDKEQKIYPWEEIFGLRVIKEFLLDYQIAKFDAQGMRIAKPIICLMKPGIREFWIFYRNAEIGDFAIKIQGIPKITADAFEDIEVNLPKKYRTAKCTCKKVKSMNFTVTCPRVIWINVPHINHKLWVARKNILLKCVQDEDELRFWKNRLFTPWGTRILTLILNSETHALREPVHENVTYSILPEKDPFFKTLKTFEIKDVISEGVSEFPIHPIKDLIDQTCHLRMISEDKQERRFYRIIFKEPVIQ